MNKPVYLGVSMLEMSKTVMYEFWYDYVKPKYGEKLDYITWLHIAEDVDTRFDTSKYDLERPLPNKKKNKK